jgi:DNA replication protein DnaC
MNNYIDFLDSHINKKTDYFDIINIIKANNIEYDNNFKKTNYDKGKYEIWKNKHELFEPKFGDLKFVNIDTNIDTIEDVINIIEKYPYEKYIKYNIDLKSLHSIKNELIKLNNMIGMEDIKKSVLNQLIYFMQKLHLSNNECIDYKHTVIYGPPGTGKTEIAEIIGKMYSKIGILKNNIFKYKDNLMVIIAGYEDEINNLLTNTNKGLDSRFIWRFKIEEYTALDMYNIFLKKVNDIKWSLDDNVINEKWFDKNKDLFKNYGRDIEKFLSNVKICHSRRVFGKDPKLIKIINKDDIEKGFNEFTKNIKKNENTTIFGLYV